MQGGLSGETVTVIWMLQRLLLLLLLLQMVANGSKIRPLSIYVWWYNAVATLRMCVNPRAPAAPLAPAARPQRPQQQQQCDRNVPKRA